MKQRDYYFDNAKFILILFVVFGHSISPLKGEHEFLYTLYKFIYLFHMPAFILIAGYFSKSFHKPGYIKKAFMRTIVPYMIFQTIYNFYYYLTGYDKHFTFSVFEPHWSLWFLISLFCWHLMLIPFAKLRKYGIIASIVLGVGVGYFSEFGSYLSIERTFIFFPMFFLGYYLKKEHFEFIRNRIKKWSTALILALIFISCYYLFPDSLKEWLLGSSSYSAMGVSDWTGGLYRLVFYGAMFLTTFCVLSLIPQKQYNFTSLGGKTLYIYLLHGFFIKTITLSSHYDDIQHIAQYVALFVACIGLCYLLASKPVRTIAKPLIELKLPQLKQNKEQI